MNGLERLHALADELLPHELAVFRLVAEACGPEMGAAVLSRLPLTGETSVWNRRRRVGVRGGGVMGPNGHPHHGAARGGGPHADQQRAGGVEEMTPESERAEHG